MKNTQKGFVVPLIIAIAVVVIGGGIYYFSRKSAPPQVSQVQTQVVPVQDKAVTAAPVVESKPATSTTPATPKKVVVQTPTPVPATLKNIWSNNAAGYSFDLPSNWIGTNKPDVHDPNEPALTGAHFGIKGLTGDQQGFSFDIQTSSKKHDVDYYKQQYQKEPTDDDLFNVFVETQKSAYDGFTLQNSKKVIINGVQGYQGTALFSDGGGTMTFYVFYTSQNTYRIQIIAPTDTWKSHEAEVLGVVGTFKIQ